jgi:ribosomal protein L23
MKSDKHGIRKAVEAAFQTHISDVNTMIDQKGRKRAFVKFAKPGEAGEIAIRLGII